MLKRRSLPSPATVAPQPAAAQVATPPLEFDTTWGEPWAVAIRPSWVSGDWRSAVSLLQQAPSLQHRDEMLLCGPPAKDQMPPWLDEWIAAMPGDPLARSLRGARLIEMAWHVRTGARADKVSESQFRQFHEILRMADAEMLEAARNHPAEHLPWVNLLTIGMGLSVPLEEQGDRYFEVEERVGVWRPAVAKMIQIAAPKWAGSEAALLHFARDITGRVPEGDPCCFAIAGAWQELILADSERVSDAAGRSEVRAALEKSRLLDPTHRLDPPGLWARNTFASVLSKFGDDAAAGPLLQILGWNPQRLSPQIFGYWGGASYVWEYGRRLGIW